MRSRAVRRSIRNERIREYFYGKKGLLSFFPYTFDIKFSDIMIYKIGGEIVIGICTCIRMPILVYKCLSEF